MTMKKLVRESIRIDEKFLDFYRDGGVGSLFELHVNPDMKDTPRSIRGIIDQDGNLLVATCRDDYATHYTIYRMFNNYGHHVDSPYNLRELKQGKSIAVQRYQKSNVWCLGESYDTEESNNISQETVEKFKNKHPELELLQINIFQMKEELLHESAVGEIPIANVETYISGMQKGIDDKIDFISEITPDCVLDFGCADGYVLNNIGNRYPAVKKLIGYDIDDQMIEKIKSKFPNISATDNWSEAIYLASEHKNIAITLMSVIHEVYSYSNNYNIHKFWKEQVFNPKFKYVVIRDMMPVKEYWKTKPSVEDIKKIKGKIFSNPKYRRSFEQHWGDISANMGNMLHWFLKYDYKTNWDREVKENYFPVSIETVKSKIPPSWKITHEEHYVFRPIADKVKRDFNIDLKYPTHVKMIIENTKK